jgi:hypothetical protein
MKESKSDKNTSKQEWFQVNRRWLHSKQSDI